MIFQLISLSKVLKISLITCGNCEASAVCYCEIKIVRENLWYFRVEIYHCSTAFKVACNFNKLFNLSTVHPQLLCFTRREKKMNLDERKKNVMILFH